MTLSPTPQTRSSEQATTDESRAETTADESSESRPNGDGSRADSTTESGSLPRDEVFDILSVSRRRAVLRYLDENEGEATLGSLAEHVAALENDVEVAALSSAQRKRVYVAMYQVHLPKMADAGVVAYDKPRGEVRLGPAADQLFPHLYLEEGTRTGGAEVTRWSLVTRLAAWAKSWL